MNDKEKTLNTNNDEIVRIIGEREKELNCLYMVEESLQDFDKDIEIVFKEFLDILPLGFQFVDACEAKISYNNKIYARKCFIQTPWVTSEDITINKNVLGKLQVFYTKKVNEKSDKFLMQEKKLLKTISQRLSQFIFHKKMKKDIESQQKAKDDLISSKREEWRVVVDLLKATDLNLYFKISRKMLNYLSWTGSKKAKNLLESSSSKTENKIDNPSTYYNENIPLQKQNSNLMLTICNKTFKIASDYISDDKILEILQKWIKENKISFLIKTLEDVNTTISEIIDAITQFLHMERNNLDFTECAKMNTSAMIINRFFSDQLSFINVAKKFVNIEDFFYILKHSIFPNNSRGKFGGKSAGIYLANSIIKEMGKVDENLQKQIKFPKTWYITSDTLIHFLHYNNLEEVVEQKYKKIDQIREEYPNIIQVFKSSYFPPEITKGLSAALDDFDKKPIIVRSSSLLEDRFGSAFSGKYKSLFLANQGNREERLEALMDAIAEVYASTFGPDPIGYRKERELLDFHEEMAIIIMEVVGKKVGKYFFPAFAGVGFTNNEFSWSQRIKRDDGLLRIVPGLGTRAVDRLSNDFPVLIAPGQPNIRINITADEVFRYSPKKIDVINLETNSFETIDIETLLKNYGNEYPMIDKLVSVVQDNRIISKSKFNLDFQNDDIVFTFNDLVKRTDFIKKTKIILDNLQATIHTPIDIEFANDGENFYLLQCRPQGFAGDHLPSSIPKDIPENNIIFTANKYISNGAIPNISHIVYVNADEYGKLSSHEELKNVGKAIGKLNTVLPKRKFILMGPGRWGSRGDIKLGVSVTYSDINNTAVLIEIAREKGNYIPDLSFGTHFFQDLVEASIRYIPLYPDDNSIIFNQSFLNRSKNILPDLVPEFSKLQDVITVIDVQEVSKGKILKILMNADLNESIAYLSTGFKNMETSSQTESAIAPHTENHWMWRLRMSEHIAQNIDSKYYGVESMYVFGSTKNANAGPASDIDLLVHFKGDEKQKLELKSWFDGWGLCLAEINYLKTGYKTDGLLDVHYITDEDIKNKNSFAIKINAITDAARPLKMGK
ncbi:MAG: PEP/pyruvate-binding domain-containing protein [Candidatus Cloacimonadota bacterium]|nr:PEP/pyruvate-binding domain-containing protein [Candidatus Cloacimonadota bacterium]